MQASISLVSSILAKCENRSLPLTQSSADSDTESVAQLRTHAPETLFPRARNGEAAYSALLLLLGAWEASHDLTNDDESPEGCYLHAIIHRLEPNPGNSAYWLRQLGQHPLFPQVHRRAQDILHKQPVPGWQLKPAWDPFLFNKWCEQARDSPPGSLEEKAALAMQRAEWDLLFAWSAEAIG